MSSDSLIDVAIRRFGDCGFDGASTRAIAAEAGTVMSSITYHFGGKEGLYLACADHIAACLTERLTPVIASQPPIEGLHREGAITAVNSLMEAMVGLMLSEESCDWARFIIREQQTPGPAFDRIYKGSMGNVVERLVALVRIARAELEDRAARALTVTLLGQVLILRAAHASVLRTLQTDHLGKDEGALLIATLRANIYSILKSEQ